MYLKILIAICFFHLCSIILCQLEKIEMGDKINIWGHSLAQSNKYLNIFTEAPNPATKWSRNKVCITWIGHNSLNRKPTHENAVRFFNINDVHSRLPLQQYYFWFSVDASTHLHTCFLNIEFYLKKFLIKLNNKKETEKGKPNKKRKYEKGIIWIESTSFVKKHHSHDNMWSQHSVRSS